MVKRNTMGFVFYIFSQQCQNADILVAACGIPKLIKSDWVKEGAVVIDVGTTYITGVNGPLGDVDYENVRDKTSAITPVPGGVGPMTVAMLMRV